MPRDAAESVLVIEVRRGSEQAWQDLIARYEGRLFAFVDSRLRNRTAAEDIVQDTFLGFLVSLPNYDAATPLETYLFSIAAHKLTDALRRKGAGRRSLSWCRILKAAGTSRPAMTAAPRALPRAANAASPKNMSSRNACVR